MRQLTRWWTWGSGQYPSANQTEFSGKMARNITRIMSSTAGLEFLSFCLGYRWSLSRAQAIKGSLLHCPFLSPQPDKLLGNKLTRTLSLTLAGAYLAGMMETRADLCPRVLIHCTAIFYSIHETGAGDLQFIGWTFQPAT
jgi:hypothetical protein